MVDIIYLFVSVMKNLTIPLCDSPHPLCTAAVGVALRLLGARLYFSRRHLPASLSLLGFERGRRGIVRIICDRRGVYSFARHLVGCIGVGTDRGDTARADAGAGRGRGRGQRWRYGIIVTKQLVSPAINAMCLHFPKPKNTIFRVQ
jgi:hypothetical protein